MKKFCQFKCTIDCFYAKDFIREACKLMDIPFDSEKYSKAIFNQNDKYGWYDRGDPRQVCIFHNDSHTERFVFLECTAGEYWAIAVQCMVEEKDIIQKEFTRLFKEVLIKVGCDPEEGMFKDVYGTEDDIYKRALKVYNVDFFK